MVDRSRVLLKTCATICFEFLANANAMQRGMKERKKCSSCLTLSCHFTDTHTHTQAHREKMCTHAFMYAGGKGACQRAHLSKVNFTLCQAALFPSSHPSSFLPNVASFDVSSLNFLATFRCSPSRRHFAPRLPRGAPTCPLPLPYMP